MPFFSVMLVSSAKYQTLSNILNILMEKMLWFSFSVLSSQKSIFIRSLFQSNRPIRSKGIVENVQ